MAEQLIHATQRKILYGFARELGMTTHSEDKTDDLHALASNLTGKDSLPTLTYGEAERLITELKHRLRFGVPKPLQSVPEENTCGVTAGQQRKIIALMCELRKLDVAPSTATIEQRVAGIIRRELHISATDAAPYAWLTYKNASQLIDIIKKYLMHAQGRQAKG